MPQVVFEIEFLEGITRFAQRLVEQRNQGGQFLPALLFLRHHALHVVG